MSYYLLLAGKILILILLAGAVLRLVLLAAKCNAKFMPEDIGNAMKSGKIHGRLKIFLFTILLLVIMVAVYVGEQYRSASVNIALTYPEASDGLNPNGSRYNMSDILGEEILSAAIQKEDFGNLTISALQSALDVAPVNNSSSGSEDPEAGLVSTQFVLSFSGNADTGNLRGTDVVNAVANAYREWFVGKYSVNYSALDISFDDIEEYDYPDLETYFTDAIYTIANFSNAYYSKDPSFMSADTGESFGSINTKIWDVYNTGLEGLSSYILSNGLSKDSEIYMDRLRYQDINQCISYLKSLSAYDVRLAAIDKYDNDMATVVYIPTYDQDYTFYMSKTKIGIDHFSADADSCSEQAGGTLDSILEDRYLMVQLDGQDPDSSVYEKADNMIEDLKNQIISLADKTRETVQDYMNTKMNGYLAITASADDSILPYLVIAGIAVLFFVILYFTRTLSVLYEQFVMREVRRDFLHEKKSE